MLSCRYIKEVLDVGYEHLVPITLDLNPLAFNGADAVMVILAGIIGACWLIKLAVFGPLGRLGLRALTNTKAKWE